MIITIEGIIGIGKSTILEIIRAAGYTVFLEPFEKNPCMKKFYEDMERWWCAVQTFMFQLRYLQFLHMRTHPADKVFCERSCMSDRWTFGEMLIKNVCKHPEEAQLYRSWFSWFEKWEGLMPDVAIIIDIPPEIALERIKRRGREMESGITLKYLQDLRDITLKNMDKLGKKVILLQELSDSPEENANNILRIIEELK